MRSFRRSRLATLAAATGAVTLAGTPVSASDWQHVGGDAGGSKYSDAEEVTSANAARLKIAWRYSTGHAKSPLGKDKKLKFQATPILFEDQVILCTPINDVVALDPATGKERWRFRADLPDIAPTGNGYACRGVTAWRDAAAAADSACASRIFTGTNDARLIALDAKSGKPCADFGAAGEIAITPTRPASYPGELQITSPPVVANGIVVVGSALGDNGRVEAPSGIVRAFDARTGLPRWTFDPVPRDAKDPARATWGDESADRTGHANVWSIMSVDESRGLVFLPTSSPSVDHYGGTRPGENRYANSVVALDARSGNVVWHFQTVHHDLWDYDVAAQPLLATLMRNGQEVPVVIQATKTGMIFTLHRETGAPVFEIEERAVPTGDVPGEWYSPTQPFPVAPRPLGPQSLKPDDAWGLTPFDRRACRKLIAENRYEGLYTPPSLEGTIHYPFISGGVNWGGGAFDIRTHIYYVMTNNVAGRLQLIPREKMPARRETDVFKDGISAQIGTPYLLTRELLSSPFGAPCNPPPWGMIHAIDMTSGEIVWERPIGSLTDTVPVLGALLPKSSVALGGPIVTAGGVVFAAGAMDNYLRALDARTGDELWKGRLPAGGQATPMTYTWRGRQYVVIAAGGHPVIGTKAGDQLVAFAIE